MRRKNIRNLKLAITAMLITVGLTGCGNKIPDVTQEQMAQIGEYAAITLLKYDANHRSRLVNAETVEAYDKKQQELKELMEMQKPEAKPEGMKPVEDTPTVELNGQTTPQQTAKSLAESLTAPEGIEVTYLGYKTCDSYPDDGSTDAYFTLDASTGKKILVLEFSVANQTSSNVAVDFFSKNAVYSVNVGDGKQYSAMTTMLLDDMSTYAGTLPAGGSQKLVLLFEVEQSAVENLSDLQLYLKSESNKYAIQM